ncbi:D-sedoheptulose-7-phosphate isomerase [Oleiharenicola lentus]|uniref:D-sedoheptulose-7-phosphate isomerase n=1 Tax=Oleiharenicola lentus TaxID=2508720 RepID=UPI003F6687C8
MPASRLDELVQRAPELSVNREIIQQCFDALRDCFRHGGKVLLCGNGGSASDAEHWAGELLKGFKRHRALSPQQQATLRPEIATQLQGALPAIPLTGFPALATAFANDVSPELIFAQLTWGLGQRGDVWIGLSTSGNARNVCAAAEVARARGLKVIGLTGSTGGKLAPLCDLAIRVPSTETYRIQEYHLPIYHCLSLMLEDEFFGEATS